MLIAGLVVALLCLLVLLGMPVLVSLAASVAVYLAVSGGWALSLPQQIIGGMNDFVLLALPLFILAGNIMNAGGITRRLVEFAIALVGFMRGGLAHVNVATSVMFGGMIGTSVADLAGTGSVLIPSMKEQKYPAPFAAALSATSSGIGPLIPPSSPMILYSAVTGTSLGALFLAGLIPGLLLALMLMGIVAWLARRHGWTPMGRFSMREILRTGLRAILPLGMPAIILGGFVFGVFTPTEAGAFAVAYALLLAGPVYRRLDLRGLYRVATNAATITGEVMLIVGLSTALGWALSNAKVPFVLAEMVDALVIFDSITLRILALLMLAIVAGMISGSPDPGDHADHLAHAPDLQYRPRALRGADRDRRRDRTGHPARRHRARRRQRDCEGGPGARHAGEHALPAGALRVPDPDRAASGIGDLVAAHARSVTRLCDFVPPGGQGRYKALTSHLEMIVCSSRTGAPSGVRVRCFPQVAVVAALVGRG